MKNKQLTMTVTICQSCIRPDHPILNKDPKQITGREIIEFINDYDPDDDNFFEITNREICDCDCDCEEE